MNFDDTMLGMIAMMQKYYYDIETTSQHILVNHMAFVKIENGLD